MLQDSITQYLSLTLFQSLSLFLTQSLSPKQSLKTLNKEMKDELSKNPEYDAFASDLRDSSEVLRSCKERLISTTPSLGALENKRVKMKEAIKEVKCSIEQSCKVVDKNDGSIVQLQLKF